MATSMNTPEEQRDFLDRCINKTRSAQHVYESLGLFSQTNDRRKDLDFPKNEANELYKKIRQIAQSYAASHRRSSDDVLADLKKRETFSNAMLGLEAQYGQAIWGEQIGHSRSFREPQKSPDDLDWDRAKDRETIRFYIHCWIVTLVVAETHATPRKRIGKGRAKPIDLTNDESSDSSGSSDVPFRAPEPPRMHPLHDDRGNNRQTVETHHQNANAQDRMTGANANMAMERESPTRRLAPLSPNKRKAPNVQGGYSTGKLQKVLKEAQVGVPFRLQPRDPYSIPGSPTLPLNTTPSLIPFQRQVQGESTQGTDGTYTPTIRDFTAETETISDPDEELADATDSMLRSPFHDDVWMQDEHVAQTTAGPLGSHQDSPRQDSVIPFTQNETTQTISEAHFGYEPVGQAQEERIQPGPSAVQAGATTLKSNVLQEKDSRKELFVLLLSYLNSLNQFAVDSHDPDTEDRMDGLLRRFWLHDTNGLREGLGENFSRVETALVSWMKMRSRLAKFRQTTGYAGMPGEGWRLYLRRMVDLRQRAQACIALQELQGVEVGEPPYSAASFDDDLVQAFHLLTRDRGCNGAEEFAGIRRYNEALLEWVREDDSSD